MYKWRYHCQIARLQGQTLQSSICLNIGVLSHVLAVRQRNIHGNIIFILIQKKIDQLDEQHGGMF